MTVPTSLNPADLGLPTPDARLRGQSATPVDTNSEQTPQTINGGSSERPADQVTISPEAQQAADEESDPAQDAADAAAPKGKDGEPLNDAEQKQVQELEARDREVRQHEQAHKAAAGSYATSGPNYSYQEGPDGKRYAVGGSVGIDVSPEATPEETIAKMQVVRAATLAPAEPSSQDRKVAAQASRTEQQARAELAAERQDSTSELDRNEDQATSGKSGTDSPTVEGNQIKKLAMFIPPTTPNLEVVA
ncbi:MAG: putative metalloprotease CJM1_0395 family protein [Planctomycetota bacterium]